MTSDALLAELGERPDDVELYRVYADALQQAGDPRGELVALQCSGRDEAARPLIDELSAALTTRLGNKPSPTYTWRRGFVDTLELDHMGDEPFAVLPALAAEPAARLLCRLAIVAVQMDGRGDLEPVLAELARLAPAFPRLAEIAIHEGMNLGNPWIDGPIGFVSPVPLYASYPRLEVLELDGTDVALGAIALPNLRRFCARVDDTAQLASIRAARWPRLVELDLDLEWSVHAALPELLDAAHAIQSLRVCAHPDLLGAIIARLPTARLATNLRKLSLAAARRDTLATCMPILLQHAAWLRRLDELRVHARQLPAGPRDQLAVALGRVLVVHD